MKYLIPAIMIFMNGFAHASPIPCVYWTSAADPKSPPSYDISRAYAAADLVVIGNANSFTSNRPQRIRIKKSIKGGPKSQIYHEGIHESGTDPWGAAIPIDGDYLMLLKSGSKYSWVDQGSGCPNLFKVTAGKVTIGKTAIYIGRLKGYFESDPKPFPIN